MKAGKEHFLWLQSDGSVFAVSKLELRPIRTAAAPTAELVLFNGQNLDGWTPVFFKNSKSQTNTQWSADSVSRVLVSPGGDFIDLQTDRIFKNFTLTLEWRFTPGGSVAPMGAALSCDPTG